MNLRSRHMFCVEHTLAQSRCSLSDDGCGCHGYGYVEGFPADSNGVRARER